MLFSGNDVRLLWDTFGVASKIELFIRDGWFSESSLLLYILPARSYGLPSILDGPIEPSLCLSLYRYETPERMWMFSLIGIWGNPAPVAPAYTVFRKAQIRDFELPKSTPSKRSKLRPGGSGLCSNSASFLGSSAYLAFILS